MLHVFHEPDTEGTNTSDNDRSNLHDLWQYHENRPTGKNCQKEKNDDEEIIVSDSHPKLPGQRVRGKNLQRA